MTSDDDILTVEAPCWECGEPVKIPQPAHSECIEYDIPNLEQLEGEHHIPASEVRELGKELRDMANTLERRDNTVKADAYRSIHIGIKLLLENHGVQDDAP